MSAYLVVGAGISGIAAAKFLAKRGEHVTLSDRHQIESERLSELQKLGIKVLKLPQDQHDPADFDQIIVSPGIADSLPLLVKARELNLPISSEIDLGISSYSGYLIGITGTNGKSTTTKMVSHLISATNVDCPACGNIGLPITACLEPAPPYLAVELSSYQIATSRPIPCDVVIFTSFSPDHLERHGSLRNYFAAKWQLVTALKPNGRLILTDKVYEYAKQFGLSLPHSLRLSIVSLASLQVVELKKEGGFFTNEGSSIPKASSLPFHDQCNLTFARIAASEVLQRPLLESEDLLASFEWLPFRFRLVGNVNHQPIFNDSKATNVEATLMALRSMKEPVYLLLGGAGKGEPYAPLLEMAPLIKKVFCYGQSGAQIYQDLHRNLTCQLFSRCEDAIEGTAKDFLEVAPAPILFSPACASFDEFRNFEHRGAFFNEKIEELLGPLSRS